MRIRRSGDSLATPGRALLYIALLGLAATVALTATAAMAQSGRPVVNIHYPDNWNLVEGTDAEAVFDIIATAPVAQDTNVYIKVTETGDYVAWHEMDGSQSSSSLRHVVIPAGQTTAEFRIPIHDDLTVEDDGAIRATLQHGMDTIVGGIMQQSFVHEGVTHQQWVSCVPGSTPNCIAFEQQAGWSIDSELDFAAVRVRDDDGRRAHPTVSIYPGLYNGSSADCSNVTTRSSTIIEGAYAEFTIVVDNPPATPTSDYLLIEANVSQNGDYIYTPSWYDYLSNEGEQSIYVTPYRTYSNVCMSGDRLIRSYWVPTQADAGTDGGSVTVTLQPIRTTEYGMYTTSAHYELGSPVAATVAVQNKN